MPAEQGFAARPAADPSARLVGMSRAARLSHCKWPLFSGHVLPYKRENPNDRRGPRALLP